jgi:hypothetical protein
MFTGYLIWVVLLILLLALILGFLGWLRPEAKEARRRAKSHGQVVSKRRGPSIQLAVKTKRDRKG